MGRGRVFGDVDRLGSPIRFLAGVLGLPAEAAVGGGHDLPGYAETPDPLVPGDLVGHGAEAGRQRVGAAARPRPGELRDRLDVAAQTPAGDGTPGPGSAAWPGGGGRNIRRGDRGRRAGPPA